MNELREVIAYLSEPAETFWCWSEQGTVVAWRAGTTIAFAAELLVVLERLAPQGLPPIGAVLLVLAACRGERPDLSTSPFEQLTALLRYGQPGDRPVLLGSVVAKLQAVHEVWNSLPSGATSKANLVAAAFAELTDLPICRDASLLRDALTSSAATITTHLHEREECCQRFLDELRTLQRALYGIDVATLKTRLQTGIDDVVVSAPVDAPLPQGTARDLLRALDDDRELAGIARLARQVLATLNLPRAVSDPDDLPDGGLSDITNRGPLDRLLLSELAHDDLTLAVRISLNEALYLRREAPPRTPPRERRILIDCGLRLWGLPRLFATAVGLAVAAGSERAFQVAAFRTAGRGVCKTDLRSREGLLAHLAALDHFVQPGTALTELAGANQDRDLTETVLITAEEVLKDPEFLKVLSELALPSLLIATVSREGRYQLVSRTPGGMRLLRQATFDLEDILSDRAKRSGDLLAPHAESDLPAIFRATPFPLFLPIGIAPERVWFAEGSGELAIAKDGRLMRFDAEALGGRTGQQLAEGVSVGPLQWCTTFSQQHHAVVGYLRQRGLSVLTVEQGTERCQVHPLAMRRETPRAVTGQRSVIFVIYQSNCEAFDAESGEIIGHIQIPLDLTWRRDRFFTLGPDGIFHRWYALSYSGGRCEFLEVYDERRGAQHAVTLIDYAEEGPVAIFARGQALYLGSGRTWEFSRASGTVLKIAPDFDQFLFGRNVGREKQTLCVNLREPIATQFDTSKFEFPLRGALLLPSPTLRHRFGGITVDGFRRLTLISKRRHYWPLSLAPDRKSIQLPKKTTPEVQTTTVSVGEGIDDRRAFGLESVSFESGRGKLYQQYGLQYARWPDGSQAVLDKRGLLHLRSSENSLPELSIVLSEGETAGWSSDGRWWGPKNFIGDNPATPAHVIAEELLQPFVERLL